MTLSTNQELAVQKCRGKTLMLEMEVQVHFFRLFLLKFKCKVLKLNFFSWVHWVKWGYFLLILKLQRSNGFSFFSAKQNDRRRNSSAKDGVKNPRTRFKSGGLRNPVLENKPLLRWIIKQILLNYFKEREFRRGLEKSVMKMFLIKIFINNWR